MDAITMLLALSLPPAEEECLDQFHAASYAQHQAARCENHLERLRWLQAMRGGEWGRWECWRDEVEGQRDYWELVATARGNATYPERVRAIGRLKERLGAAYFRAGWRPAEIPDGWAFSRRGE